MRKTMLLTVLVLPLLGFTGSAEEKFLSQPAMAEAFGYSSDESGGSSYLGVDTRDVTSDRLGALNLKEEKGVEITMVDQDAPAGKAGIKEHDVILTLNGAEVESVVQLRRMIHETPPGRVVTLGLSRNGQPLTLKVPLADRKKEFGYSSDGKHYSFAMPAIPAMPAMPAMPDIDIPVSVLVVHSSMRSGLMVENLTSQLGDFFGAKNGQGVLVRSVEKGTPAEKAGFRAGDVIVKVNGEQVGDAGDFTRALRARNPGKDNTVTVGVIRDRKEQTITLTIPYRKQSEMFEESFDVPDIDAETQEIVAQTEDEVARMKPQMDLAAQEMERLKPQLDEAERCLSEQKEELKQQMEEMQQEIQERQQELQERTQELREQREERRQELREQQEELRQQMREQQEQMQEDMRRPATGHAEI